MTVAAKLICKYINIIYLHIENNWLAIDMDLQLPIVKVLKIDFAQLTENG